jgi:hypothetical protein
MDARQIVEHAVRGRVDAGFAEPRATRARRAVRARRRCGRLVRLSELCLGCIRAHCAVNLADKSVVGVGGSNDEGKRQADNFARFPIRVGEHLFMRFAQSPRALTRAIRIVRALSQE